MILDLDFRNVWRQLSDVLIFVLLSHVFVWTLFVYSEQYLEYGAEYSTDCLYAVAVYSFKWIVFSITWYFFAAELFICIIYI